MYYVPSYRAWFFRQNLRPAYEYHRRFLQQLQFRRAAGRWILKAPTHMVSHIDCVRFCRFSSETVDFVSNLFCVLLRPAHARHTRAFIGETQSNCASDAAPCSGYNCNLTFKPHVAAHL